MGREGWVVFSKNKNQKLLTSVSYALACQPLCRLRAAHAATYSGQNFNYIVSFYSSQPPLHPYITCVLVGPPTYRQHPILSLFSPRNMCLTLHIFISALQVFFLLILSLIVFISIFFCFNSFLKSSFFFNCILLYFFLSDFVLNLLIFFKLR